MASLTPKAAMSMALPSTTSSKTSLETKEEKIRVSARPKRSPSTKRRNTEAEEMSDEYEWDLVNESPQRS